MSTETATSPITRLDAAGICPFDSTLEFLE